MRKSNQVWSENSFKDQYKRYYRVLVIYALKMVADGTVAEDIVQEVFVSILNLKRSFDDELQLRSYLYTGVRNRVLNYQKHVNIKQNYIMRAQEDSHVYHLNANGEEEFFSEEVYRRLFELVDSLPERQREVFIKLMEGKKLREIAEEMNISLETVRTQKQRGIKTLRKHMKNEMLLLFLLLIR